MYALATFLRSAIAAPGFSRQSAQSTAGLALMWLLACGASPALAQSPVEPAAIKPMAAASAASSASSAPTAAKLSAAGFSAVEGSREAPEPAVQNIVQEDDNNRIEELRVRGQTVQAKVKPKGRAPEYEILLGEPGRDMSGGASSSKGAAGQRVWRLMNF